MVLKEKIKEVKKEKKKFERQLRQRKRDLSNDERQQLILQRAFLSFDLDDSGTIDKEEFLMFVEEENLARVFENGQDATEIFGMIDYNHSGDIDCAEFMQWYSSTPKLGNEMSKRLLNALFRKDNSHQLAQRLMLKDAVLMQIKTTTNIT